MTAHTLPDIVGSGAGVTQRLSATPGPRARWLLLTATTSGGSSHCTIGDSSVSASQGGHLVQNVPNIIPMNGADATDTYDLYNLWVFVPNGTTLTTSYFV